MRSPIAGRLPGLPGLLSALRGRLAAEGGYIIIQIALLYTVLMGLVGAGVDYGSLVVENTRIQHAIDAASLAGARSLVSGNNPGTAAATTTINSYLAQYGYQDGVNNTTVGMSFAASQTGGLTDTAIVTVTRVHTFFFWRAIRINQTTISKTARAVANGAMVDVMLSLDLTGSMEMSGTSDLANLRTAVVAFINQMNPNSSDTFGPKVGLARWAGVGCSWTRGNGNNTGNGNSTWSPNVNNQRGDGDRYLDIESSTGYSEYVIPCYDDMTVLSNLTYNKANLIKLADNSGGGSCPALPFVYPGMPNNTSLYACELKVSDWFAPQVYGTPTTITGLQYYNSTQSSGNQPVYTGTKIANGIKVVRDDTYPYNAWATANGGRNDSFTGNYARKVLVLMTDGVNENYPNSNGNPANDSTWDNDARTAAAALKLGADNTAGTPDDVEIYVVGFFCTVGSFDLSRTSTPERWCASEMAYTSAPHPCPNNSWSSSDASPIDTLLRDISSSPSGTCTHYFPIRKTESLPQLFRVLAGSVARGRLAE